MGNLAVNFDLMQVLSRLETVSSKHWFGIIQPYWGANNIADDFVTYKEGAIVFFCGHTYATHAYQIKDNPELETRLAEIRERVSAVLDGRWNITSKALAWEILDIQETIKLEPFQQRFMQRYLQDGLAFGSLRWQEEYLRVLMLLPYPLR